MARSLRNCTALLLLALAGCERPDVVPASDRLEAPAVGTIEGDVLVLGAHRGRVILLLFDQARPPPPKGSGRPVNFLVVPEERFGGGDVAGFRFPLVPHGMYELRGFVDVDGDFDPFFWIVNGPTAGDVLGGALDPATASLVPIELTGERARVTAIFDGTNARAALPLERPSFRIEGAPSIAADATAPVRMTLVAHAPAGRYVDADPARLGFHQSLERDAAGATVDANGDGLPDTFPKVFLRRLSDGDALVDDPDDVLIPAIVDPLPALPTLLQPEPRAPIVTQTLEVIVPPVAIRSATRERIPLPPGKYAVLVVAESGQLWRVPNELAPGEDALEGRGLTASESDPTQAGLFEVTAPEGRMAGGITGLVRAPARADAPVIVLAFAADAPPPPAGTGAPRGVAIVPREALATGEASYTIRGLPPGDYGLVALHDLDRDFAPFVPALQGATAGDVVRRLGPIAVGEAIAQAPVLVLADGEAAPLERPSFTIEEGLTISAEVSGYTRFTLRATPSTHPLVATDPALLALPIAYDRDAAGAIRDADGDGLPDLFPRVFLVRLDDADPAGIAEAVPRVLLPCAVDPLPWLPALAGDAPAPILASAIDVLVAPVAVRLGDGGPEVLPELPAGRYGVIVISATGQTWRVPNELTPARALVAGDATSAEGSAAVVTPAPDAAPGSVHGSVLYEGEASGRLFVLLFARADPPPPAGTGRPIRSARTTLSPGAGRADYVVSHVPDGEWLVALVLDADGDFHGGLGPLAGATAGDLVATLPSLVTVAGGAAQAQEFTLTDASRVMTERPAFELPAEVALARDALRPVRLTLRSTTVAFADRVEDAGAQFVVARQGATLQDADFDHLPDVWPRVIVARLGPDGALVDPPEGIPAAVDSFFFAPALARGERTPVEELPIVLQPALLRVQPDGTRERLGELTPGRYSVTLIAESGQTWTLPDALGEDALAPAAQGRYAPAAAQSGVISIGEDRSVVERGSLAGTVVYDGAERGDVFVFAFDAEAPPPPDGLGAPVAATAIPSPAQLPGAGLRAPFVLRDLPPGRYLLRALLDVDRDFLGDRTVAAGGSRGDLVGAVGPVEVRDAPLAVGELRLTAALPLERPSFTLDPATPPRASRAAMPIGALQVAGALRLVATPLATPMVTTAPDGVTFLVGFVDRDGDGVPDELAGIPQLFPQILLVEQGPAGRAIPCVVDAAAFPSLFDPGTGAPLVDARAPAAEVTCGYLNGAVDPATGTWTMPPPEGLWDVLVVQSTGQSWRLPNELDPALYPARAPDGVAGQGAHFEVLP